ncbi:transglutaminase domain-containing protein [Lachnospiraceae bacterium 47-T17]
MGMRWKTGMMLLLAALVLWIFSPTAAHAADYELKIGKRLDIGLGGAVYKSSDKSVAYVDKEGHVTAKKEGTATITAKSGELETDCVVRVKKDAKKPSLIVAADEIRILSEKLVLVDEDEEAGLFTYKVKVRLRNTSSHAVSSVYLVAGAGQKTCSFYIKNLEGGGEKTFTKSVTLRQDEAELSLVRIRVRTGGMYHTCNYETGNAIYEYATEDTTAPKITGFVGKNSYNGSIPYQTVFKGKEDSYDFFKYVKAVDDRDAKVDFRVDTSKVDFSKKGTYTITYTAVDSAGNKAKAKAKIAVRTNDSYDKLADEVLRAIIRADWSDQRKVTAIYNYAHGHISYTGTSDKSSWEREAVRGIQNGRGDCFTYYSVVRLLLTRCGIPNLQVNRVRGHGRHWWNMAYVGTGFYHVDACPRRSGGKLCLLTDAQLKAYSANRGNHSHIWDYAGKPKSATKVIAYY